MPRTLVTYFSQGGTTARVGKQIADGLRSSGHQVDLVRINEVGKHPSLDGYDVLGIGFPVYYFRPPFNVMEYVQSLPSLKGLPTFVFVLHGTYRFDAANPVRHTFKSKGAADVGFFHCFGRDLYLEYLKQHKLFSPDHPTKEELHRALLFGQEVAARAARREFLETEDDLPAGPVYRIERFFMSKWIVQQIYSRLFMISGRKCDGCGLCVKLCPTKNLTARKDGKPVMGRECIACLTCETRCPKGAITSPMSWPILQPFMMYNVYHASRDPSLDYVPAEHSLGRVRRLPL